MPSILLVEDNADQRLMRRMILERVGYTVREAGGPQEALEAVAGKQPDCVLMDMRMPRAADGLELIDRLRALAPDLPVVVLSGFLGDLEGTPQASRVDELLSKPVRTERLLHAISRLTRPAALVLLLISAALRGQELRFESSGRGETAAYLELSSPGADWSKPGRQAAVARIMVDGTVSQHLYLWNGPSARTYAVVLGRLSTGTHTLRVERDPASAGTLQIGYGPIRTEEVPPGDARFPLIAHAPMLYERETARGKFSDIPLLMYATRLDGAIEYTVVFSNEDGGTSTRDLMARWGRATDIEFVYRVWPEPAGKPARTLIQTRGHKEVPFAGAYRDLHPVLMPVTENNMVDAAPASSQGLLFRPLPVEVAAGEGSRERVMDADPAAYLLMAKELERENKIRPWGKFEGESIGDPRTYLYIEFESRLEAGWIEAVVQPRGSKRWRRSSLGLAGDHIEAGGWRRVAVEMPPGTRERGVATLGFSCLSSRRLVKEDVPKNGRCTLLRLGRVFFLDDAYRPGEPLRFIPPSRNGEVIGVGEMAAFEAF